MKKVFALLLALCMILAFAACTGTNPSGDPSGSPAGESPEDLIGKPFSAKKDMAVIINGKTYPVRVDSADVLSVLGSEYEYGETISCVYDGYDKTFAYDGITVSTVPDGEKDIIEMFTITGSKYTTARNITVGATREEVIAAYGEKYFDDGYLTYSESADINNISEMRIQFLFDGDTVSEIYVYSPSYSN